MSFFFKISVKIYTIPVFNFRHASQKNMALQHNVQIWEMSPFATNDSNDQHLAVFVSYVPACKCTWLYTSVFVHSSQGTSGALINILHRDSPLPNVMAGHPCHTGGDGLAWWGCSLLRPAGSWVNFSLMASHPLALMIKDDARRQRDDKLQEENGR